VALTGAALVTMLAASAAWAAFDALRKRLAGEMSATALVAAITTGQWPFLAAWLVLSGAWHLEAGYLLPGAATVALNVGANLLFVRALQISPLSVTVPFLSFTPVFSTLFSALLLGELPDGRQQFGIVLVVAGAFMVNLRGDEGLSARSVLRAMLHERGSLMMIGVALLWSLTAALDKLAMRYASAPVHGVVQTAGVALWLLALLAIRGELSSLHLSRSARWPFALALLVAAAGIGLQLVAIQLTLVGIVEAVKRAIGMAAAVVVGRLAFHELTTTGKLAGIGLMIPGVVLIVL
jgi:drug/metabolite transporter (DMT)-like permease